MSVLSKGTTFATNQQVTATTLNNLVDNATFASGAVDNSTTQLSGGAIIVKDAGITPAKLSTGGPSWDSSGNVTSTGDINVGDDLDVAGDAVVDGLLDLSGATAGQVKFPATQNASSNANTLDDYEEGTWTPSLGGTATYTTQTGRYTKIGRVVHVEGRLKINAIGSGDTGTISGLPFTAGADSAASIGYFADINTTGYVSVYAFVVGGTTTIQTSGMATPAAGVTSPANFFKSGTEVIFSATYAV